MLQEEQPLARWGEGKGGAGMNHYPPFSAFLLPPPLVLKDRLAPPFV